MGPRTTRVRAARATAWILLIAIAIVAAGCAQQPQGDAPIRIGIVLPLTGEASSFGEGGVAGAQLAIDEINAAGGVSGRRVEAIYEDDGCAANGGVTAMTKLVSVDNVDAVVGFVCSQAAAAGIPVAAEAGTPVVIMAASSPGLTGLGDAVFRVYPSDSFAGPFIARYASEELGAQRAAIVSVQSEWGEGIRAGFEREFAALGGEVILSEKVQADQRDFRTLIARLREQDIDLLVIPMQPAGGVAFVQQARAAGLEAQMIGGDYFDTVEVSLAQGTDGLMYVTASVGSPDEFKARAREASGKEPDIITPLAYDAVRIAAQAIGEAGTDSAALRDALERTSLEGVSTRKIEFDSNGDLRTPAYDVKRVSGGNVTVVAQG